METILCSPHPHTANLAQVKAPVYAQQTPTPQCARRLKDRVAEKKRALRLQTVVPVPVEPFCSSDSMKEPLCVRVCVAKEDQCPLIDLE